MTTGTQTKKERRLEGEVCRGYEVNHMSRSVTPYVKGMQKKSQLWHLTATMVWYLPHHPVAHSHKPGKVQVLFDRASKYNGVSLNVIFHQSQGLTNKLITVLS